ncbi:MAG: 1,4-dihydroxy-2-naphthoate octaprenyltransferase [Schleiferiaceae bacterium]|nr:1,4-dihydroxy-2-naphthoate octaprenyltransferase [Schleiferiaceae bacterium]
MKDWIAAARLRTLPLAFSSILLGTFLASFYGSFNPWILVLCLLTTLLYQVLSNYANDYGDGVKGTDDNRKGEKRSVASGVISAKQMRNAVIVVATLAFISGTALSILGTKGLPIAVTILFIGLGIVAIWAAIRYTVGKSAYGYRGQGDLYVLLFFGWLGVMGSFYLQAKSLNAWILLPATSVGMLAAGVLNLNNMRDREEDAKNGKITLAVRLGLRGAKKYQATLIIGALVLMTLFAWHETSSIMGFLFWLVSPLLIRVLVKSIQAEKPEEFDPLLKPLAIGTLLFCVVAGLGFLWAI